MLGLYKVLGPYIVGKRKTETVRQRHNLGIRTLLPLGYAQHSIVGGEPDSHSEC